MESEFCNPIALWFYDYQTLIAGTFAILAAFISGAFLYNTQKSATARHHATLEADRAKTKNEEENRRLSALLSTLPRLEEINQLNLYAGSKLDARLGTDQFEYDLGDSSDVTFPDGIGPEIWSALKDAPPDIGRTACDLDVQIKLHNFRIQTSEDFLSPVLRAEMLRRPPLIRMNCRTILRYVSAQTGVPLHE